MMNIIGYSILSVLDYGILYVLSGASDWPRRKGDEQRKLDKEAIILTSFHSAS